MAYPPATSSGFLHSRAPPIGVGWAVRYFLWGAADPNIRLPPFHFGRRPSMRRPGNHRPMHRQPVAVLSSLAICREHAKPQRQLNPRLRFVESPQQPKIFRVFRTLGITFAEFSLDFRPLRALYIIASTTHCCRWGLACSRLNRFNTNPLRQMVGDTYSTHPICGRLPFDGSRPPRPFAPRPTLPCGV